MRLLTLKIDEPLPGRVFPAMAAEHGAEEAARRYRAVVLTTLRQLKNLSDCRLRLSVTPADGDEAVRFWLLPKLAAAWRHDAGIFHAAGWEIDFGSAAGEFLIHATGEITCPNLGARWVHTALLGLVTSEQPVSGPAADGGEYFRAQSLLVDATAAPRLLPELPMISTSEHWLEALESPLGAALKQAWNEEA
jgi:glycosyltransferase A (GT-A) superfamily protein (DUF2064 family)